MKRVPSVNLPNLLTVFRIFMVPLVVVVLLTEFKFEKWFFFNREELAVAIFILASLTDLLDGYLARKRNQVTTLGQLLDPIADKLLVASVLISLVEMRLTHAWVVVIIVGREFTVTGLRLIAAIHQVVIPAGRLGKWKMVVEVIAICCIIWGNQRDWDWVQLTGNWLLYLVALVAVVSMVEYFYKFSKKVDLFREGEEGG
jgi:CDP-diacylglycerol---glycerol-3-phosphate 3-phosphatidyltransferase